MIKWIGECASGSPIFLNITMSSPAKISAKAFLHERVKNKIPFHGVDTYPVHIRLTVGTRSLSFKSWLFYHVKAEKYAGEGITVSDVLEAETQLLHWLLNRAEPGTSVEQLKEQYLFYSADLLSIADEKFWQFMVAFFTTEGLPAYVDFLNGQEGMHHSSFILANLERSLHPEVFKRLQEKAVSNAPPYIPLADFSRRYGNHRLPVLPLWHWQDPPLQEAFQQLVANSYPRYLLSKPVQLINTLVQGKAFQSF